MIIDEENNNIFIVEKINNLKNNLNKDKINLREIQSDIKQLNEYNNIENYKYLNTLLEPEKEKGVKIPTEIPVPTCSFQFHTYATFRTNSNGNDVFTCNPWFLASEGLQGKKIEVDGHTFYLAGSVSPYFFCRQETIDGMSDSTYWSSATAFTFTIPPVYSKYRLVSACATLKYLGELNQAQGIMGVAITYDKSCNIALGYGMAEGNYAYGSTTENFKKYGNFEMIRDSFYSHDSSCLEGIRVLYFPLDNSFNEFRKVYDGSKTTWSYNAEANSPVATINEEFFKSGFNWVFYLQDCPYKDTQRLYRVDFFMNYECIPKTEFLNYMPISVNVYPYLSKDLINNFIKEVQEKAIQKINN